MSVEIGKSGIHQTGVFAKRAFRAGEVVLKWDTSKRVTCNDPTSPLDSEGTYAHPYDEQTSFIVQSPECFVNHSCGNNTEVRDFSDIAVRDIAVGEEITSNYETDGAGISFLCNCGLEYCRKHIGVAPNVQNP